MTRLRGRRWSRGLAAVVGVLVVAGGLAASTVATSGAAPRSVPPSSITLVFAGQVVGEGGIGPFVDDYPPIEGGVARTFTVPSGQRLVIDSVYADVFERWTPATYPRWGITVGLSTWYDLGQTCPYPGFERAYDVPLSAALVANFDGESQARRAGNMSGPIFVEGGRMISGAAWAPGGNSEVFVHVTVHGRIEPASNNPAPPVCGG